MKLVVWMPIATGSMGSPANDRMGLGMRHIAHSFANPVSFHLWLRILTSLPKGSRT
ncbi:hypothetical protein EV561_104377 [Rhizobium sp. BK376]|nr:hypothetical protein EV561_104377 [Rhizobium sp. BK376]